MLNKVSNYAFYDLKQKRAITLPHKKILLGLCVYGISLLCYSVYSYTDLYGYERQLSSVNQNIKFAKQKFQQKLGLQYFGVLKNEISRENTGFYPYFQDLTTFKMNGVWFNHITVANRGKKVPYIEISGDSNKPESLQAALTDLTQLSRFSNPLMRINHFSVLKSIKPTRRNKLTASDKYKRENFKQLYSFMIANDSYIPTPKKRRR